jgi:hypothetical protein
MTPAPRSLQLPWFLLPLTAIAFLAMVVSVSTQMLTDLQSTPSSDCTPDNLRGLWQVRGGTLTLKLQGDRWMGTYTLLHEFRGQVRGMLQGTLQANQLQFTWKETAQRGTAQGGEGLFVFQQECRQFSGSTLSQPHGDLGRWQGQKLPPAQP